MTKKMLALGLAAVLAFSCIGCKGRQADTGQGGESTQAVKEDSQGQKERKFCRQRIRLSWPAMWSRPH